MSAEGKEIPASTATETKSDKNKKAKTEEALIAAAASIAASTATLAATPAIQSGARAKSPNPRQKQGTQASDPANIPPPPKGEWQRIEWDKKSTHDQWVEYAAFAAVIKDVPPEDFKPLPAGKKGATFAAHSSPQARA